MNVVQMPRLCFSWVQYCTTHIVYHFNVMTRCAHALGTHSFILCRVYVLSFRERKRQLHMNISMTLLVRSQSCFNYAGSPTYPLIVVGAAAGIYKLSQSREISILPAETQNWSGVLSRENGVGEKIQQGTTDPQHSHETL